MEEERVEFREECVILLRINEGVEVHFLEDLEFECEQLGDGDSADPLEGEVVEVDVVVVLNGQDQAGEKKPVDVEFVESELRLRHVVAVQVHQRHD